MAYKDIKTIASDLRVTKNDIGAFLSVDDSCNLVWANSRVTSTGGVWQYNIVEEDCYIVLPPARLNVGLCVAIMRGKTNRTRNEHTGITSSKANPKVVIFPYNNNTSDTGDPNFDYIQGGPNFYCSDGIKWDTTSNSYITNDLEWDEYSSIMFKSVYCGADSTTGEEKYSWVIINGVGSWDAEELVETDLPFTEIKKLYSQFAVVAQTSSVNSLKASAEITDTEFLALESINQNGLPVRTSNDTSTVCLKPQCAIEVETSTDSGGSSDDPKKLSTFVKANSYILGRFTNNIDTPHPVLYTEFTKASVNAFGPTSNWDSYGTETEPALNTVEVNNIDNSINWLGYIYDDQANTWWSNIKNKSFSKRLGLRQKGTIVGLDGSKTRTIKTLGAVQVIASIDFSAIKTVNQTSYVTSSIRSIHTLIQSFFETTVDNTMPYTNVFKVPGDCFGADDTSITDSDIIVLSSAGLGRSKSDSGYGSVIEIPITSKDRENGKVNLVFEFIYKTSNVTEGDQAETEAAFREITNDTNQYVLLNFIGVELLKPTSISPEIEFESFSLSGLGNRGTYTSGKTDEIQNAFMDCNAVSSPNPSTASNYYIGLVTRNGSYDYISSIEGGSSGKAFFESGKYYPSDNITKTVLEYDTGFDIATEKDTRAIKARLIIDWANRKYQFNGSIRIDGEEYVGTLNSTFAETSTNIEFYRSGVVGRKLIDAIHIQYNGLFRLPWLSFYKSETERGIFDARINISNYKTVVHSTGSVELLMDYRCGWERAETKWVETVYLDGSEYDGLIDDYTTQTAETASPSKACIVPSHAMMTAVNKFSQATSLVPADRALLPYLYIDDTKEIRYFTTNWVNNKLNQSDPFATSSKSPRVVANPFCELVFSPSSTGMLVCNVEIPIQSGLSSTGYLVVKQVSVDTESTAYGDYELVKDSGASINSAFNPGYNKTKISFTDKVVASREIRYTIIIYDAPWTAATVLNSSAALNIAANSAIVRYRPSDASLELTKDGINDFKTLFDTGSYKGPETISNTSMNSVFNYNADLTQEDNDKTNFDIENFSQMMFGTAATESVTSTTVKNHGACFSFHAYVLKEGV